MEVVPNVKAETVLNLTIKKVRRGSIVYTDKFKVYDALMFCGYRHLKVDHGKHFSQGRVYINGLEGFWSWAKERLRLAIGGLARWLRPEGYAEAQTSWCGSQDISFVP